MIAWWRHQMETFSALLAICAGNSPVPGEFPTQRPVTRSFDVYFDLRPNKRLSKQPWGWWFETPTRSLWRQCNGTTHDCHADFRRITNTVQLKNCLTQQTAFRSRLIVLCIPGWISNYIHHKVWDEITYSFSNFNGAAVEVWERLSKVNPC